MSVHLIPLTYFGIRKLAWGERARNAARLYHENLDEVTCFGPRSR